MRKHISELLASVLDEYDFGVDDMEDSCEIGMYTPEGEDWVFYITSDEDFIKFVEDFDPDEEFDTLYRSGVSGLPRPADLIQDQLWKQERLNNVLDAYYEAKRGNR